MEVVLSGELMIFLKKLIIYHRNILEQVFEVTREQYCKQDIKTCEVLLIKLVLYKPNYQEDVTVELTREEIKILGDICYNYTGINYTIIKTDEGIRQELRDLYKIIK